MNPFYCLSVPQSAFKDFNHNLFNPKLDVQTCLNENPNQVLSTYVDSAEFILNGYCYYGNNSLQRDKGRTIETNPRNMFSTSHVSS